MIAEQLRLDGAVVRTALDKALRVQLLALWASVWPPADMPPAHAPR